jgi:hypothetical protein
MVQSSDTCVVLVVATGQQREAPKTREKEGVSLQQQQDCMQQYLLSISKESQTKVLVRNHLRSPDQRIFQLFLKRSNHAKFPGNLLCECNCSTLVAQKSPPAQLI